MNFNRALKFPVKMLAFKKNSSGYLKNFIAIVNDTSLVINFSILLRGAITRMCPSPGIEEAAATARVTVH